MEAEIQDRLIGNPTRFAILWHALPSPKVSNSRPLRSSHFDFMFENGGHLVTFEMARIPIPGERLALTRLDNHRIAYLELEGKLSPGLQGEDRGYVTRWATGTFQCLKRSPAKRIIELTSDRFSAQIVLMPKLKLETPPSLEEASLGRSSQAETGSFLSESDQISTPPMVDLRLQVPPSRPMFIPGGNRPSTAFPAVALNDLWPEVQDWEMYVSRWALKEKNV